MTLGVASKEKATTMQEVVFLWGRRGQRKKRKAPLTMPNVREY